MSTTSADKTPSQFPSPTGNRPSPLQLSLVELFAETLLSRAHLAFFMSTYNDAEAQQDCIHQGKAALEEAERLCTLGEQTADKHLRAKCWYVRGFLADVCGEDEHATKYFQLAVELDESYMRLERVRWHLQRLEDAEGLNDMWDADSFTGSEHAWEARSPNKGDAQERGDIWNAASSFGNQKSPRSLRRSSDPSLSAIGSRDSNRHSVLYGQLMRDVLLSRSSSQPRDASTLSPPSTTSQRIALNPRGSFGSSSSGRLDMDAIIEELKNAPAQVRKAPPLHQPPVKAVSGWGRPVAAKVQRDAQKSRDDMSRLTAKIERAKADRLERERAFRLAAAALTGPRPLGEEALLSDTPSVPELDTATGGPQHAVRPLKLHVITSTNGGLSTSYTVSPTSPSPLRDAFVPDDVVDEPVASE